MTEQENLSDQEILALAEQEGFTSAAVIPVEKLEFDPSLRKYCADNLCGNYGKNYSCPPFCGTPEEMKQRTEPYRRAWIFQTIGEVGSWENTEKIREVRDRHNQKSRSLIRRLRAGGREGLAMLAGPCSACEVCAGFQDEPCRHPEEIPSCISAYCMNAEKMAADAGLAYWCEEGKVAFFSLYLTRE